MCVVGYAALIVFTRASGKRTLSKMNAYDVIINVAIGSMLATLVLSDSVPVVNGLCALAVLVALQHAVSWATARWTLAERLVKAEPELLLFRGQFRHSVMRGARIAESEIRTAIRAKGLPRLEDVDAVVLETTGDITVIERQRAAIEILTDVRGARAVSATP